MVFVKLVPESVHGQVLGVDFQEESFWEENLPDDNVQEILKKGAIIIYSSYPIKQGVFVTPSKVEARSYSGGKPIHSRRVRLTDVAWIDFNEGQYAKVK